MCLLAFVAFMLQNKARNASFLDSEIGQSQTACAANMTLAKREVATVIASNPAGPLRHGRVYVTSVAR